MATIVRSAPVVREIVEAGDGVAWDDWVRPVVDEAGLVLANGEALLDTRVAQSACGGLAHWKYVKEGKAGTMLFTHVDNWSVARPWTVWVTNDRIAFGCRDFATGSTFVGSGVLAPVALVATGVSASRAAARTRGRIAAGQIRFEWLIGIRARTATGRTLWGKDTVNHELTLLVTSTNDVTSLEAITLELAEDPFPIAAWIADVAHTHREARFSTVFGDAHWTARRARTARTDPRILPNELESSSKNKSSATWRTWTFDIPIGFGRHMQRKLDEGGNISDGAETGEGPPAGYRTAPLVTLVGAPWQA